MKRILLTILLPLSALASDLHSMQIFPDTYISGTKEVSYTFPNNKTPWPAVANGSAIYITRIVTYMSVGSNFNGNLVFWAKRNSDQSALQYAGFTVINGIILGQDGGRYADDFEPDSFMLDPGDSIIMADSAGTIGSAESLVSIFIWYRLTP